MHHPPLLLLLLFAATMATVMATIQFTGTNLSGGEFGNTVPGTYGTDYTYPTTAEVDYFVSAGMNTFRVPFRWQRLQHNIGDSFDTAEVGRLTTIINYITNTKGAYAILDPHDYARYKGNVIGGGTVSDADFAAFWSTLAGLFANNNKVFFNLVNEPHGMPTEQWLSAAQAAVNAIRAVPANNLVMVPGNGYTGAWKWLDSYYGTPNSKVMINFTDPGNNYVFEVHQYSDTDGSGTSEVCVSSTIGQERLVQFTQWLRTNKKRGFLGEFAGGNNSVCQTAMNGLLQYMKDNDDVWIGWTWWSAGPWWGQYMYSIEPGAPANWYLTNVLANFLGTPQTTTSGGNQGGSTSSSPSGSTSAGSSIAPFWLL